MTHMTQDEKEAFLADLHVGVIALSDGDNGPLTVPIWYDYEPGGDLWLLTGPDSRKGKLLAEGTRVGLCAQTEDAPYKYVSVEGPVVSISPGDVQAHTLPMAVRYLGEEIGRQYAEANASDNSVLVKIKPERWLAVDYSKM